MKRDIAICIILSIVTCGIYSLYWLACINDEINAIAGKQNETSGVMVILLSIITCGIYLLYWYYKVGAACDDIAVSRGEAPKNQGILYILLAIFGFSIINNAFIQDNINKFIAPPPPSV